MKFQRLVLSWARYILLLLAVIIAIFVDWIAELVFSTKFPLEYILSFAAFFYLYWLRSKIENNLDWKEYYEKHKA